MNKRETAILFRLVLTIFMSTALIAGCAQTNHFSPPIVSQDRAVTQENVPARGSATPGVGGQHYEEVVVTANKRYSAYGDNEVDDSFLAEQPLADDEELWVITRADNPDKSTDEDSPGSGAMVATVPVAALGEFAGDDMLADRPGGMINVPLPLQHTAVNAKVNGYISSVNVQQDFSNPFNQKIEATYLFPLPEKSAVSEFVMTIGDRKIRGILREKEEAQAIYDAARSQGYQASLLVQHRPNVFEQKVANIEPGKSISVDIQYFHTLAYKDGWYSFVFPTVVGPRYNPPGTSNPITAVSRNSGQLAGSGVTAPYLRPGERTAHDLSIVVEIDAGVEIEELKSTHEIVAIRTQPDTAAVRLADHKTIPNRDFVLDFQVAGQQLKSNLVTSWDEASGQGYFSLMLYPPAKARNLPRRPMEMVFVLDCSGSMHGLPLRQAKDAARAALSMMNENDTFQIIRFSEQATQLGSRPLAATRENLRRAERYLKSLDSTGGTAMIEGIKAALDFPQDESRLRFVTFMTDGYIGNETDIIAAIHQRIGAARIFSFGVGSSVNRYLMERMAKEGRGAVAYLGSQDSATKIMRDFFGRISQPALTDIAIDWGSMTVSDVYPAKIPDIFVGRSVVITGKYLGVAGEVKVSGTAGDQIRTFKLGTDAAEAELPFLAQIWARLRIADLADRMTFEQDPHNELENAIRKTALLYQLVSDYTSFVAVDATEITEGDHGVTVPQAVPVPAGVRYETTVNQD